jgi:hypothetical protein
MNYSQYCILSTLTFSTCFARIVFVHVYIQYSFIRLGLMKDNIIITKHYCLSQLLIVENPEKPRKTQTIHYSHPPPPSHDTRYSSGTKYCIVHQKLITIRTIINNWQIVNAVLPKSYFSPMKTLQMKFFFNFCATRILGMLYEALYMYKAE